MIDYLLEFRLRGSAKEYVKNLIFVVARRFDVRGVAVNRVVPHITMVGPFSTTLENRLVMDLERICRNYDLLSFKFKGFMSFGSWLFGKRVLAVRIEPSPELVDLRSKLVKTLAEYCALGKFDKKKWKPHATIAFKDIDKKLKQIKEHLESQKCPEIKHYVLRLTLPRKMRGVKEARILCEYDFLQRRRLTRSEALSRRIVSETMAILKKRINILQHDS